MKGMSRGFFFSRYAFRALRMELILFHLVLVAYALSPWWVGTRELGRLEEIVLPCLMVAAGWLAGRIMLVDPLTSLRASWRTMPWSAGEMAWGRAALVMVAVFLPWLAAH